MQVTTQMYQEFSQMEKSGRNTITLYHRLSTVGLIKMPYRLFCYELQKIHHQEKTKKARVMEEHNARSPHLSVCPQCGRLASKE